MSEYQSLLRSSSQIDFDIQGGFSPVITKLEDMLKSDMNNNNKQNQSKPQANQQNQKPQANQSSPPLPRIQPISMDVLWLCPPNELRYEDEVKKSSIWDASPVRMIEKTVKEFNNGRPSIMVASDVTGTRIKKNEYRLVARNNQAELVPFTEKKMYKKPFLTGLTEELGTFDQTSLYIGAHGSHLINVPPGKVAKVWLGNEPVLLGQGPHVIHNPNMQPIKSDVLCDVNQSYITHGNYHIIRVPPGMLVRVWLNNVPYFLKSREVPYVFKDQTFRVEGPSNAPYLALTTLYIPHGNYHILQIPQGKIAKVWFGTQPDILESRVNEPYIFNDQYFRLSKKNENEPFENADEEILIHGSIKRILPRTGKVAITYQNGQLVTYGPTEGKPIIITSPTHTFDGFLQINTQTLEFPSPGTREERLREHNKKGVGANNNSLDMDTINYEIFRTSDGLPIGVKLLVVYEITDPDATLKKLSKDQILPHIERLVVADMGMVIQNCSSGDFLKSNQTQAHSTRRNDGSQNQNNVGLGVASAPDFYEHLQDEVKNRLYDDFQEYGIKLVRANVETPKILDKNIANRMAEFSLMNSEARAKESVLDRNFNIARQEASQKAITVKIEREQMNNNIVTGAEAELEAAKRSAEAIKIRSQADASAQMALIEVENRKQLMELEVARQRAEMYRKYPELYQLEMARTQAIAMSKVQTSIISPEVASGFFNMGQSNSLFNLMLKSPSNQGGE